MNNQPQIGLTEKEMETKEFIEMVSRTAFLVKTEDLQALVEKYQRLEITAPIFDPTAYLAVRKTMPGHVKVAKAFLAFRRVLDELAKEGMKE